MPCCYLKAFQPIWHSDRRTPAIHTLAGASCKEGGLQKDFGLHVSLCVCFPNIHATFPGTLFAVHLDQCHRLIPQPRRAPPVTKRLPGKAPSKINQVCACECAYVEVSKKVARGTVSAHPDTIYNTLAEGRLAHCMFWHMHRSVFGELPAWGPQTCRYRNSRRLSALRQAQKISHLGKGIQTQQQVCLSLCTSVT